MIVPRKWQKRVEQFYNFWYGSFNVCNCIIKNKLKTWWLQNLYMKNLIKIKYIIVDLDSRLRHYMILHKCTTYLMSNTTWEESFIKAKFKASREKNIYIFFQKKWKPLEKRIHFSKIYRARLVCVFKNWKLLFKNICGNTCGWKSALKCVKCCLKTENCCLKT